MLDEDLKCLKECIEELKLINHNSIPGIINNLNLIYIKNNFNKQVEKLEKNINELKQTHSYNKRN